MLVSEYRPLPLRYIPSPTLRKRLRPARLKKHVRGMRQFRRKVLVAYGRLSGWPGGMTGADRAIIVR